MREETLDRPLVTILPNLTPIVLLQFFAASADYTAVEWRRFPILAWRISSLYNGASHIVSVEPVTVDDVCDPWVYVLPGPWWVESMGSWWDDFDQVIAWAQKSILQEHERQLKRSEQVKTQP